MRAILFSPAGDFEYLRQEEGMGSIQARQPGEIGLCGFYEYRFY